MWYTSVLRYFRPESLTRKTTRAGSPDWDCSSSRIAAARFAPDEKPPKIPSTRPSSLAQRSASSSVTSSVPSSTRSSQRGGRIE